MSHHERLEKRRWPSFTTETRGAEPVDGGEREPGPVASSKAVSICMAPAAANKKKIAGKLAPRTRATRFAASSSTRARSTSARADLRPEELAVELGEADGEPRPDERRGVHGSNRLFVLERNGQRESDDRPIDEARELTRPEMLEDGAHKRLALAGFTAAAAVCEQVDCPPGTALSGAG
jgi:hypothetical protein